MSLGIANYPRDGSDGNVLLQIVDDLLYRAKGEGKNRLHHLPG